MAKRCRAQIAQANILHGFSQVGSKVPVSIGHATISPVDEILSEQLIKNADQALYQAKAAGHNRTTGTA